MQMISGRIIFFLVFVCILEKCSRKYCTLCVWSNVKQNNKKRKKKKTTSKTTGIDQKWEPPPRATPQTHHEPSRNPPRATPQPTDTHCTKPKIKLKINQTPSNLNHWQLLNPSLATP